MTQQITVHACFSTLGLLANPSNVAHIITGLSMNGPTIRDHRIDAAIEATITIHK